MKRALIIDDESGNRSLIAELLSSHLQILEASNAREGIQLALDESPDVIILDVNMPEMDGFEACRRLREQPKTREIPIIFLSAEAAPDSKIRGLDIGADDYVCKPVHGKELLARINAKFRRKLHEKEFTTTISIGNLTMDPLAKEVRLNGSPVPLTDSEFQMLRYFLEHPNQVISRAKLLGDLWPDVVVRDRTIDAHVAHLRKKLHGFSCQLATVHRAGYIFKAA